MFKIILIFFLLVTFVPIVRRALMWLVMGNSISDNQKKYSKPNSSQSSTKKEGQINVDYVPKESKGHDFKGGQYVDYEEVKD